MNLFEAARFRVAQYLFRKAATWTLFPTWMRYAFMDIAFNTLITEGYKKNSAVFACVQALAFGFSEPPLRFYNGEEIVDSGPVADLLKRPNPDMGLQTLLQYTITYASIGGNSYWLKTRDRSRRVVELWPLHDGQMQPVSGGTRLVDHYELLDGNGTVISDVPREDVVQFMWAVDPLYPWRGMGALVACSRDVDMDSEMTAYTFSLLKNNAVPPLALIVPPGEILQQFQLDRMRDQWMQKYGGDNRGTPAILEGGMDVKQLSFNVNTLAAEAMRSIPESRICAAFKVPAVVAMLWVGMQQMTYNNVEGMMRYFTEQTLIPLWPRFASTLSRSLTDDFGFDIDDHVAFDTSGVMAMQSRLLEKGEFVDRAVRGAYMTRNEARELLGQPHVAGGDVFLTPLNLIPEDAVEAPAKAARPAVESKASDSRTARRAAALTIGRVLQSIRKTHEGWMAADVQRFFADLADKVVERARALGENGLRDLALEIKAQKAGERFLDLLGMTEEKEQLTLPGLFQDSDWMDLLSVFGSWTYNIIDASWDTMNLALGVDVTLNRNDPAVVAVVQTLGTRISQISQTTLDGVREVLAEGYRNGWSIDHIVAGDPESGVPGLRDTVQGLAYRGPGGGWVRLTPEQRARMIARTELGTAQNSATMSRYGSTGVDRVLVLDDGFDNSHEFCKAINNKVVPLSWAKEHPLCHPNCLVGDTSIQVLTGDALLAGFAREFHGEVVVLRTALNQEITCTPNHPILTRQGWVSAGTLREGDEVIGCVRGEQEVSALYDPNNDQVIPTIEDVVRALLESPSVTSGIVPGSAVDFHGDGVPGEVNVVLTDGFLEGDVLNALGGKQFSQLQLVDAGDGAAFAFAALRALEEFGLGADSTAHGGMSSSRVFGEFLGRPEGVEFALAEGAQTTPFERASETVIIDADFGSQLPNADAGEVASVQRGVVSGLGDGVAALVEGAGELAARQAALVGEIVEALAGFVAPIEIVEIKRESFSGHVYNLSTRSRCYVANGIITHNCVRAYAPEYDAPVDEGAIAAAEAAGTCPFG